MRTDRKIDFDRLENLIAQAGAIVDLLRVATHGENSRALDETMGNAAWAVQMMLFEMHEILFSESAAAADVVSEGGAA